MLIYFNSHQYAADMITYWVILSYCIIKLAFLDQYKTHEIVSKVAFKDVNNWFTLDFIC